jgi:DMSO/TMAO reductase YedYZ molybdopterin-dependent catalytic subunit
VLSAGPTPRVATDEWSFTLTTEAGTDRTWTWEEFMALPSEQVTVDIHCVTSWSKLGTKWRGVSLDVLLAETPSTAAYAMAHSFGEYTTNVPVADLTGGRAWVAYEFEGQPLHPAHGGPARLLIPHLYFWKSAKWVRGLQLLDHDEPGFWEALGYHMYGDPWKEQRYRGQ